jgi:hypothetical protein
LISYSIKDNAKLKTYRWLLDTPPNYADQCSKSSQFMAGCRGLGWSLRYFGPEFEELTVSSPV